MLWFEPALYISRHVALACLVLTLIWPTSQPSHASGIPLGPGIGAQARATVIALKQLQLTMRSPNRIKLICPKMLVVEANAHG